MSYKRKSYSDLDKIASRFLRTNNQLKPPIDIDLIIERSGLDIIPLPGLKKEGQLSGALAGDFSCIYYDEREDEKFPTRIRFTLAHELAHFILHKNLIEDELLSTNLLWKAGLRKLYDDSSSFEKEADDLAGLLLVPSQLFKEFYGSGKTHNEIAKIFNVTTIVIEIRSRKEFSSTRY